MIDENRDSRRNPFPGLRAFHSDEDYLFFGRDEQTAELATRLRRNRFLAVVGTSGSGKSSLVRAGLIPQLLAGGMRKAGSSWEVAVMRPGGRPIAHLADALCAADLYDREVEGVFANLQVTLGRSRLGLVEAIRQSDMEEGTNLLVVVDQFEEIFRFRNAGAGAQEQAHDFVNLLLEASGMADVPIYIVITMRSDFIGDCSQFAGLAEAVNRGEYLIPRLSREQCRAAIEGPIRVAGGEITPQLVQRVLNDLGADQDRLPVLQHALMRTWDAWQADRAGGEAIDLRHYEATGGMREALSRHADEVFGGLPGGGHRRIAERLFKALTERGADNREVRRPARLDALLEVTGASGSELRAVIEAFRIAGRTFLMPGEGVALEPMTVIDISHESLMRVWRRLQGWVEEEAQSARVYRRLADTAHLHAQGKAGLFRDPDLQIALAWKRTGEPNAAWGARYHEGFEEAMRFLDASEAAERAELDAREAARQRELEQARILAATQARAARNFKRFAAGVSALALVAIALSIWAFVLKDRAEKSERRADASAGAAETARAEAVVARDRALNEQGRVWFERAGFLLEEKRFLGAKLLAARALGFEGFGRGARDDAFRAEFPVLLRPQSDEWNAAAALIRDLPEYPTIWMSPTIAQCGLYVTALEFSPDGGTLVTPIGSDGSHHTIALWDVASGAVRFAIPTNYVISSLDVSADGSLLAFVDEQLGTPTAHIWNLAKREEVRQIHLPARWNGICFSPDGATLATASNDGTVRLWEVASGREVETMRGSWRYADRLAFSPDGEMISFTSNDSTVRILKVHAPTEAPRELTGHSGSITDIEFSQDGRLLASASFDGSARTWDLESGTPRLVLSHPDSQGVMGVSFQPGGKLIASASMDDRVRFWDRENGAPVAVIEGSERTGRPRGVFTVRFSPDGRLLGVGRMDGTIEIIDVETRKGRYQTAGHTSSLRGLASSPDGTLLASCGEDQTIRLWSAASGEELARFQGRAAFQAVDFSPAGAILAAAAADGAIQLYDLAQREEIAKLRGHSASVNAIDFDASGTKLASGSADGSVRLWDVSDAAQGREISRFEHGGPVLAIALGPDRLLASAGEDRKARLWDMASGKVFHDLEGHGGGINALAFSPDGAVLASGSRDRTVRLWDIASGREIARLDGHTGAVAGVAFSPDGTLLASAGAEHDRSIRLWSVWTRRLLATLEGHSAGVSAVAFCPDGNTLSSAGEEGSVRLWDLSHQEIGNFESGGEPVLAVAYDPEGRLMATSGSAGTILLRDAADGRRLRSLEGHTAQIVDLAFSPDGRYLVSASRDRTVSLWHAATGERLWTSETFGDWVASMSFSPDGSLLAAASFERSVRVLDVATGRVVHVLGSHSGVVRSAVFNPDGTQVATADSDGTIRFWDMRSGTEASRINTQSVPAIPGGIDFQSNGRLLAYCDGSGSVRLWDALNGELRATLDSPGTVVLGIRFSPDGRLLAALGNHELRLWDIAASKAVGVFEYAGAEQAYAFWHVRFSPDGERIAFGAQDGGVHITNARWRARDMSRLTDRLDWFTLEGARGLQPTLQRSLYRPARIELDSPSEDSHLAILRRWKERGEGEGMWRELFHHYLDAGNLEAASLLLERLPGETSAGERARLARAFVAEAERASDRPDGLARAARLLGRAEKLAPGLPRIFAVRSLLLDARGDAEEAEQELERGISLALKLGETSRMELLDLVDRQFTRHLRRGEIAQAAGALDAVLGLPGISQTSQSLLLDRYWRAVRSDALARYQAGEPAAARAAALAEILVWAAGQIPTEKASWPLLDALEALDPSSKGAGLIDRGAAWKYLDNGSDPGTAWRAPEFDDEAWPSGAAPLGFGDQRERTSLRRSIAGNDAAGELTTTFYFRHRFEVGALDGALASLAVELVRDDGAVVYLNGEELFRDAMPGGPVGYRTLASVIASNEEETRLRVFRVRTKLLRKGSNVLAAEVHQENASSSDLHFELGLRLQRSAETILGLDDLAAIERALPGMMGILPASLRSKGSREFVLAEAPDLASAESKDPELWRIRGRVQSWLNRRGAATEALKQELAFREASKESGDLLRRSDLHAEIAKNLADQGRSEELESRLREWFEAEIRARGAIRINCGGGAFLESGGTLWIGDAYCRDGSPVSFDGAVLGAADPALHAWVREFAVGNEQGYHLPVPAGRYRVRLHLAETAGPNPGMRQFDILLQGDVVLDGYDGIRACGFEVEDLRDFGARAESGFLDITLRARPGSAPSRVAAIEIFPIDEEEHGRLLVDQNDDRWVRRELDEHRTVRINCGSIKDYRAADGKLWSRDRWYLGGRPPTRGSRSSSQFARAIEKTSDEFLYLTERFFSGPMPWAYRVPLPAGRYRVSLHFAELWSLNAEVDHRVFDVLLEGKQVMERYDIARAVGFAAPDVHIFEADVRDGHLDIEFVQQVEYPKISAIEIEPIGG